jgi:hypothetical protein
VLAVLAKGYQPMFDWAASADLAFSRPHPNAPLAGDSGSGTDFKDINIHWN